jgi:hypothetical protein
MVRNGCYKRSRLRQPLDALPDLLGLSDALKSRGGREIFEIDIDSR